MVDAFAEKQSLEEKEEWNLLKLEIANLEIALRDITKSSELVLCHNDLNHGNNFYDSSRDKLLFVDFEFSDFGFSFFDLGMPCLLFVLRKIYLVALAFDDDLSSLLLIFKEITFANGLP